MRAQVIRAFGDADVLEAAELPNPVAGRGQVLVRVEATSVNPVDTKVRRNGPAFAPELPAVLGFDVAGVVVARGPGAERFAVGDLVYGCAGGVRGTAGANAELMPCDERLLARRPTRLSAREAAALPLVTITAWDGLDRASVGPGCDVLVRGGTGGVGHVAVQLAKVRGARVVATVSTPEKAELARGLGADDVVDHTTESVDDAVARCTDGRGFDVVFDATGGSDLAWSFAAAGLNGRVVSIVTAFDADLRPMHAKGLSLHAVFMLVPLIYDLGREAHGRLLEEAAALVEAGRLRPLLDPRHFSLNDLADAHRHLESGRAVGKVVVDVAGS